jgi:hypothetical protein
MNLLRTAIVKLIALAVIAAGLAGMRANEFTRRYVQNASYTFASATPEAIDAMYADAAQVGYRGHDSMISRETSNNATTLSIVIEADSWGELSNEETAFRSRLEKAARARNLTINGTSTSSGSRMPDIFKSRRMNFIAFAALAAFGIATLVLSFRVFGGGRREEVPELGSAAGS